MIYCLYFQYIEGKKNKNDASLITNPFCDIKRLRGVFFFLGLSPTPFVSIKLILETRHHFPCHIRCVQSML